jgi:cell division protein FtsB
MMKLILSNFLRRVADAVQRNRARLIRIALYLLGVLIVAWLIYFAVEKFYGWRYEKTVNALERKFSEEEAKANAAEARERALKVQIETLNARQQFLEAQAKAADKRLGETTIVYRTVKEAYEVVRDNPVVPACVSYADACKELSGLGFNCK